jgi:hypothetical protein
LGLDKDLDDGTLGVVDKLDMGEPSLSLIHERQDEAVVKKVLLLAFSEAASDLGLDKDRGELESPPLSERLDDTVVKTVRELISVSSLRMASIKDPDAALERRNRRAKKPGGLDRKDRDEDGLGGGTSLSKGAVTRILPLGIVLRRDGCDRVLLVVSTGSDIKVDTCCKS